MSILDKLNKKKANNKSNIESDPTPDTELAYKEIHKFLATTSILIKKEMTTYVDGLIKAKFKKKSDINRFEKNFNDSAITDIYWFTQKDGFELDKFVAVGLKIKSFNELQIKEEEKLIKFNKKEPNWFKLTGEDGEIPWESISFLKRKSAKQAVRDFNLNYKKILDIKNVKIDLSIICASKTLSGKISDIGSIFSKRVDTHKEDISSSIDSSVSDVLSKIGIKRNPEIIKILRDTKQKVKEKVKESSIKDYKKNLEKITELLASKYLNIL